MCEDTMPCTPARNYKLRVTPVSSSFACMYAHTPAEFHRYDIRLCSQYAWDAHCQMANGITWTGRYPAWGHIKPVEYYCSTCDTRARSIIITPRKLANMSFDGILDTHSWCFSNFYKYSSTPCICIRARCLVMATSTLCICIRARCLVN